MYIVYFEDGSIVTYDDVIINAWDGEIKLAINSEDNFPTTKKRIEEGNIIHKIVTAHGYTVWERYVL